MRGVIHVYVVPTCSVSPQKNARARGTLGSKPEAPTRSPNDTMMTMGRSLRPWRSSAAPAGKRSTPPGDAEPGEGLRVEFKLARQNVKRFVRIDPEITLCW